MALRKLGDRWLAKSFIANEVAPDGTRKRREVARVFDKKKEAEAWLAEQKRARATGVFVEPSRLTFGQFVTQWLAGPLAIGPQVGNTKRSYEEITRLYLVPL